MQLSDVDVLNPDNFVGGPPHDQFQLLRREAPVFWQESPRGEGCWVLSRYKDIWKVSLDQATFSSAKRGTILRDWNEEEFAATQGLLINMDPPRHTKYRRIVNLGFSPKMVNRLVPRVRDIANGIIDNIAARGTADFVRDVAAELPLQVIVEMMGVPIEDRHLIFDWSNTMIGFDDPQYSTTPDTGKIAAAQLYMYAHELAEQRRKNPKDDLISVLLEAEVEGDKLDEADFNQFFLLLLVAGNETTRNTISGGMLALIEHPEQRARLLADPSLIGTAVEEMVRWVSPVQVFVRTATHDTEVRGVPIKENQRLTLWYGSANRDEEMFPDGHRFDVGRTPNDHLGFGIGPHFCLGANLAKLEIQIMFEELLRRLPDIELDGSLERLRSYFISGVKTMPVRFTPRPMAGTVAGTVTGTVT
jgi:cholest-4-en-3-one 26-monooxygenase